MEEIELQTYGNWKIPTLWVAVDGIAVRAALDLTYPLCRVHSETSSILREVENPQRRPEMLPSQSDRSAEELDYWFNCDLQIENLFLRTRFVDARDFSMPAYEGIHVLLGLECMREFVNFEIQLSRNVLRIQPRPGQLRGTPTIFGEPIK